MADDDEIDVLGDFSGDFNLPLEGDSGLLEKTILVSQNSDLLNFDYTIHPQWLLDKPSANPENWYNDNSAATTSDYIEVDGMSQVSVENCITDESGWTDKEKNLLQRGLEIFGKSSIRLSQFISSKSSAEVRYYLKNFFTGSLNHYRIPDTSDNLLNSDVLNSDQIPASIEEVIAAVNTGFPTVKSPAKKTFRRSSSSGSSTSSNNLSQSISENSGNANRKHRRKIVQKGKAKRKILVKFKAEGYAPKKVLKQEIRIKLKKPQRSNLSWQPEGSKVIEKNRDSIQIVDQKQMTGKSLSVPISKGEEIVTIKHEEDSSDASIDIEDIDEPKATTEKSNYDIIEKDSIVKPSKSKLEIEKPTEGNSRNNIPISPEIAQQLNSLEEPKMEVVLDRIMVTELEKYINSDFFEGRAAKTPERYLKIRNHIINSWNSSKPNYVYKTYMRVGLKNCGDVTCISRIHYFLEQIGAINFGCEQIKYERPLSKILQYTDIVRSKGRPPKCVLSRELTELGPRQRFKKKFSNDGEGGLTMVHGDQGEIVGTTIIKEPAAKPRPYLKKPTIRLIYCRPFPPERPQAYSVKITLSSLILMDFHSHSYQTEVMGLVGGLWDYQEGALKICCYEPCKNIASSSTHCDMCPISQAKAVESIHDKNFEILGWFHSHPTFAPEPSQQDLDTQQCLQQWIGHGKPCLGVILSPFNLNGALISSPFRCWLVDKKPNFEDQLIPYRLKVDVVADDFHMQQFIKSMRSIVSFKNEAGAEEKRISFKRPYFQDATISHLDKFIFSINMCLAKIGSLPKSKCDEILQVVKSLIIEEEL
ncbi:histone H2A deubiquitinase MYSM1-like isoform X1 [Euwallacea similis]|uniref:histone H2A deubiquitinase MYSM1-like isoform X1 n=2 Tax=Euwallacea similis TaxID=1736056 RepID=UPI00344F577B